MKHHVSHGEITRMEQNRRLAAAYVKMNDKGRDVLDMVTRKLSEINEVLYEAKYKDGIISEK